MGSFAEDVYPHRTDRARFTRVLLRKIDSWSEVTSVGYGDHVPGDVQRCRIDMNRGSYSCNYAPVDADKRRIRGLLRGWNRTVSDRYLDLQLVQRMENRRHASVQAAFELIRQNAPAGCVMFLMNEIERNRQPHFFGRSLWDGWGYDQFFSALLHWDDRHCFGLINALRREQGRYGAGGTPGHLWAAVRNWIAANQSNGVYREFRVVVR